MCGYAPVVSLISAVKELGTKDVTLVKYQTSGDTSGDYSSVVGYAGIIITKKEIHPLVKLAKDTVETYVKEGKIISPPDELTSEMMEKAGVFVSIHKFDELRGCIGTFEPTKDKAAEEGIKICLESIQELREIQGLRGVHIMAIEWEEKVPEIIKAAGLYPRPQLA